MDEIKQIEESLKLDNDSPVQLASYLTRLAGWNSFYTEQLRNLQIIKPRIWLEIQSNEEVPDKDYPESTAYQKRDKPLSDKKTEMIWASTKNGKEETNLTFQLKRIDILYRSISKRLSAIENDYRMSKSQI